MEEQKILIQNDFDDKGRHTDLRLEMWGIDREKRTLIEQCYEKCIDEVRKIMETT